MNTTVRMKASQIYKDWHVIDAAGRPLGRVATEAAILLRGKHKPTYEPHLDGGDFVIVVNASKVRVSGRKEQQIKYYTHSGYPGGLKVRSFTEQLERYPERVIQQAVWGMLPGGPLAKKMLRHLKVYAGPDHPHVSQIASTQKEQAARAEAQEALKTAALKAPRLRPLSIVQGAPIPEPEVAAAPAPAPKAAPKAPRGKAPKAAAATTAPVELEAAVSEEVPAEHIAPAEAGVEQGEVIVEAKPRRTRKAAAAAPAAEAEAAPKPRARKKAETDATAEAAPTEKKTTTRRRTAPKTEE